MRWKPALLLAAAVVLVAAPAFAHSEITSTQPEQGARVARAPERVVVRFSEPPADVRIRVFDGCGDKVSGRSTIKGSAATTPISGSSSGRWRVVVKTISSEDDHLASERFGFRVAGRARCGEQQNGAAPSPTETPRAAADSREDADSTTSAGTGQGSVVAAVVAGVVVVAGAAGVIKLRKRT
jgi:methionine-rich copper-binding protein CopC